MAHRLGVPEGSLRCDIFSTLIANIANENMIKACIFDFDGVVVDSEKKYHYLGWQLVAKEIGADFSYEEYCPFKSAGRAKVIPYLFEKVGKVATDEDIAIYSKLRQEKMDFAFANVSEKDIMPGVIDFINLLKSHGIKVGVASASASSSGVAKRLNIFDLFDTFVDGNAGCRHKPSPDIFLLCASNLCIEPSECVVFEDSINGVKGAINAGMKVVGVQTHFTDLADKIIDDFTDCDLTTLQFE